MIDDLTVEQPDPDAPPTEEEIAASERLREALEREPPDGALPQADLARSLRAAHAPAELSPARNELLVRRALATAPRKGNVVYVLFGLGTAAAIAASVALAVGLRPNTGGTAGVGPSGDAAALAYSRPAEGLFDEKFPTTGGTSDRVERIAAARERDFRANRFAQWGAR